MALTPGGSPYVEASDLVADYPTTSLAVANKIDTKLNSISPTATGFFTFFASGLDYAFGRDSSDGSLRFTGSQNNASFYRFRTTTGGVVLEAMTVGNNGTITGAGASLGAWTAFTPTFTNFTLGNGSTAARWARIGRWVVYFGTVTAGSTSSLPTSGNPWLASLPVNHQSGASYIGNCYWLDQSLSKIYHGQARTVSGSSVAFTIQKVSGSYPLEIVPDTTENPFTLASGDIMHWQVMYEAAS